LILGVFFGSPASFFRALQQNLQAAFGIRVPILLEMQFRDVAETQTGGQFVTQIMPGVLQSGQRIPLLPLLPTQSDSDVGVPAIGADVDLRDRHIPEPGVVQFEADQFGKFLADSFRYA
jgi:hypothetical protein